jgi:hypothetical protein
MGLDNKRLQALQLCRIPADRVLTKYGADAWDLLVLLVSIADLQANGKLRNSMDVALQVAAKITKKPVEEYNDIEVRNRALQ